MARRPLLAELHAHTTWSDGVLNPGELVDLYGSSGFDVLAITDHVVHSAVDRHVRAETYAAYLDEIDAEAERARRRYGLLLLPGLELTIEDPDPRQAGHAVAVGLRRFVSVDDGLEAALGDARAAGAALIAAHPYPLAKAAASHRGTACFAEHREWAAEAVDRFELSTATSASTGSPSAACRRSRPATSTCPSTCSPGRRSSAASRASAQSWRS